MDPFELVNRLTADDIMLSEEASAYKLDISLREPEKIAEVFSEYFRNHPQSIPKKIHQIWIGPYTPPWKWINSFKIEFMRDFPDWEYKLWRENDIAELTLINRDLYETEQSLSGKTDILRYELLYQFGGMYIDADSEWLNRKNFDDLIANTSSSGLFAGWEDEVMVAVGVIGSSRNNPILGHLVKLLNLTFNETRIKQKYPTWISLGPRLLSEATKYFEITKFPQHFFYPVSWLRNNCSIDTSQFPNSYMMQYGYTSNELHKHFEDLV